MLLRAFLLVLVAALGLGLPLSGSLDSWMHSGQEWCDSRSTEWDAQHSATRIPTPGRAGRPADPIEPQGHTLTVNRSPIDVTTPTPTPAVDLDIVPVATPGVVAWSLAFDDSLWIAADDAAYVLMDRVVSGSSLATGAAEGLVGRLAKLPALLASAAAQRAGDDLAFEAIVGDAAAEFAACRPADLATEVAVATPVVDAATIVDAVVPVVEGPAAEDLAFAGVLDETAASFAADLASAAGPATAEVLPLEALPEAVIEIIPVEPVPAELVEVARPAPAAEAAEDLAFAAVVDETVTVFAADLLAAAAPRLVEAAAEPIAIEVADVPADLVADADEDARGRRLAEAMRLTNKALTAWVDLLHAHTIVSLIP